MKFLFDLFPVILFFIAYSATEDIFIATAVTIVAAIGQVAYVWFRHRKVEKMLLISLALVVVMGGLTLAFHDKRFIMWKPTVLYWIFALVLTVSMLTFKKNLLKAMMNEQMQLPEVAWSKLNWSWAGFFAIMGFLNIYVAYNFTEATWVKFKMFGGLGLMLVFVVLQALMLAKHIDGKETK